MLLRSLVRLRRVGFGRGQFSRGARRGLLGLTRLPGGALFVREFDPLLRLLVLEKGWISSSRHRYLRDGSPLTLVRPGPQSRLSAPAIQAESAGARRARPSGKRAVTVASRASRS